MNTSVKSKVNRLGRIGQIVTVLLIISAIISLVVQIDLMAECNRQMQGGIEVIESMGVEVEEVTVLPADDGARLSQIIGVGQLAGSLIVYGFLMWVAAGFRRCDSPFEEGVIRRMNVFAWVLLVFSVLTQIAYALPELIQTVQMRLGSLYLLDALQRMILPSFSLAVALFVLFLVRVFRHGAELQREVDETL